jgi:WD40 repeat protein
MSINHLSFNDIITNVICSTNEGYIVYSIELNLEKKLYTELDGGVGITKMFKKTNIILLVGGGSHPFKSKDTLVLWDQLKKQSLIEIDMKEPIKNILITQDKIISVIEEKVNLFDWSGTLLGKKATYSNEKGLCVVNTNLNMIVTLGIGKGQIALWKYASDIYKTIDAHLSNVEVIAVSNNGKYIATASEKGTLIRIFNVDSLLMEHEFRRGAHSANIHDLCFSNDGKLLACCSGNGTVHFFDLNDDPNIISKNTKSMLSGLQIVLPKYFGSQWGFKQVNLQNTSKSICAFDHKNDLHVVTYDGNYYKIICKDNEFSDIITGHLHVNNK